MEILCFFFLKMLTEIQIVVLSSLFLRDTFSKAPEDNTRDPDLRTPPSLGPGAEPCLWQLRSALGRWRPRRVCFSALLFPSCSFFFLSSLPSQVTYGNLVDLQFFPGPGQCSANPGRAPFFAPKFRIDFLKVFSPFLPPFLITFWSFFLLIYVPFSRPIFGSCSFFRYSSFFDFLLFRRTLAHPYSTA